jgi:UDP-N-acetylglucosamine 2-epimerase (non-hydrolysing)
MNRQIISKLAAIHLCATQNNSNNLIKEGIKENIYVVGNTGLDYISKENNVYGDKVLVTFHRRDNLPNIDLWFKAVNLLAGKYKNLKFTIPIHLNPEIRKFAHLLTNLKIIEPMTHKQTILFLKECRFVISDSGGLQEDCSFLNKKIIVCRKNTERTESLGIHSFLCTEPSKLEKIADEIYKNYKVNSLCPYGDGSSWQKIVDILKKIL